VSEALNGVAKRLNVPITSVALAYAMQKVSGTPHLPHVHAFGILTSSIKGTLRVSDSRRPQSHSS